MSDSDSPCARYNGRMMTLDEVVEMTGIPKATHYGYRTSGKGPKGYRIGVYVRFWCKDVLAWIEKHQDDWESS